MKNWPVLLSIEIESSEGGTTHRMLTEEEAVDVALEKERIVAYYF